ncbi:hypothetical protein E2493_06085 [Sphingomonas parva]|uniref:Uncharacterized protein n=1 Tax=Sphingomonas parva TaxID=2555898 RepID=A0A4Y8ZSV3_9SPHN|nr:hypothetical protein [Sphingomonas parva]TFI59093.1 hypothetical protein E2493_06085 [Sphingomonas parva]
MIEAVIVSLPLILIALARLVEAAAIVILARRSDAPLALAEDGGRRLRLRTTFRRTDPGGRAVLEEEARQPRSPAGSANPDEGRGRGKA